MRAVVFYEHGGADVLRYETDWPEPALRAGQARLAVKAVALNHLDIFVRRGMPAIHTELPHISGGDVAGVVLEVGEGVDPALVGQRMLLDPKLPQGAFGEHTQGGMCEQVCVPAGNLVPIPDGVSFEAAAALPIAYGTAWRMLIRRGRVSAGEQVLVLGASGGVGTACVQIAALAGCVVYAAASSDEKLQKLRTLGAHHLINVQRENFSAAVWRLTERRGADVIVDYSGRDTWPGSIRALGQGGRLLTCGATSGYEAVTDLRYVWAREQTIVGCNGWDRDGIEALLELVGAKKIVPVIDRVLPLEQARGAEEAIERREIFGKVILKP
ncbi:MAG: zinc-binding dehydrogenase [Chloroflexi bacterium]|nr:zinc-binding dehydrogenase [Chloroflexota bacterium]